jgi:hypothetical protein
MTEAMADPGKCIGFAINSQNKKRPASLPPGYQLL